MNGSLVRRAFALGLWLGAVACHEDAPLKLPPPLPQAPTPGAVAAGAHDDQTDLTTPAGGPGAAKVQRDDKPPATKPVRSQSAPRKAAAPAPASRAKSTTTKNAVPLPGSNTPVPTTPAPAPVPAATPAQKPVAPAKRVVVPRTANVHVELPPGLQADLDADPRMQNWVNRVVAIADECHAKNRSIRGAIQARVTMHENDRPDADIRALPGQLSSVVACATGSLMRTKMPLFTGREGAAYDVRIVFE